LKLYFSISAVINGLPAANLVISLKPLEANFIAKLFLLAKSKSAIEVIKTRLIPLARVITPNIPEAEILSGRKICNEGDFPETAKILSATALDDSLRRHGVSVLLKAGHLTGEDLIDYFYNAEDGSTTTLPSKRVYTRNTHGTGCTLSSAFAAALAKGESLTEAAVSAKKYIEQAIISGADYEIGHGHGPVNHFFLGYIK
jgi:hydroxymethylpyrimidine/phosphomethylpyrimidine kinase